MTTANPVKDVRLLAATAAKLVDLSDAAGAITLDGQVDMPPLPMVGPNGDTPKIHALGAGYTITLPAAYMGDIVEALPQPGDTDPSFWVLMEASGYCLIYKAEAASASKGPGGTMNLQPGQAATRQVMLVSVDSEDAYHGQVITADTTPDATKDETLFDFDTTGDGSVSLITAGQQAVAAGHIKVLATPQELN